MQCINFRSDVQQYNVEEWLFWVLFSELILFVEFMEPGQLSISLYGVCQISDLNTEPLSVDTVFFFKYYFCSVRIMSVHYGFFFSSLVQQSSVLTADANTNA